MWRQRLPETDLLSAVSVIVAPYELSGALQSFPKKEIKDGHSLWIAPVSSFSLLCGLNKYSLKSLCGVPSYFSFHLLLLYIMIVGLCILQVLTFLPSSHVLLLYASPPQCWSSQTSSHCVSACLSCLQPITMIIYSRNKKWPKCKWSACIVLISSVSCSPHFKCKCTPSAASLHIYLSKYWAMQNLTIITK